MSNVCAPASTNARSLFDAAEQLTNQLNRQVDIKHFSVIPSDGYLTVLVDDTDAYQMICLLAPKHCIDFDANVLKVHVRYMGQ